MFRLWIRLVTHHKPVRDMTIEDDSADTRTHKVMRAIEQGCEAFDLSIPVWFEMNVRDFQRHAACRFTQDNFMEEIPFEYMEIRMIEEDDDDTA